MDKPPLTAKEVFDRAQELATREESQAYLDQACESNAELRERVEELLRAYDEAGTALDKPSTDAGVTSDVVPGQWFDMGNLPDASVEGVESRIGPYKLLQRIGESGMGVVFIAELQEPVRRIVAVKVIKAGMDSAEVIARFEAERQALALMDHPNEVLRKSAGESS
jgi:serine/threonine protein kinase